MRFPTRLLAAHSVFALLLWAGFVLVVAAVTAGIAVFGQVTGSVLEPASQLARWYALFTGISLTREYLPLYVAHGQTRRAFAGQAAVTVTLFAPLLAVLLTVAHLLENLLYALAGWPQRLSGTHLFTTTTQVGLIFAEYTVEFAAWTVAGALLGAAFYRWQGGGLLMIPVAVALVVAVSSAVGSGLRLPMVSRLELGVDLPESLPLALAAGAGVLVLGMALIWPIIRDMPLRNQRG